MTREKYNYSGRVRTWQGRFLPHLEVQGGIYFVTYCLIDAVPAKALAELREERARKIELARMCRKLNAKKRREIDDDYFEKVDQYCDAGYGSRLLARDDVAEIVAESLEYFHRERYLLKAWCIMPTHVHVDFQLLDDWALDRVVGTWKSYTAKRILRLIGSDEDHVWQADYYDRLVRSPEELQAYCEYTMNNPERAGLENWRWMKQY